jgi:hypothetical protein
VALGGADYSAVETTVSTTHLATQQAAHAQPIESAVTAAIDEAVRAAIFRSVWRPFDAANGHSLSAAYIRTLFRPDRTAHCRTVQPAHQVANPPANSPTDAGAV